jgi:hypothetical protein
VENALKEFREINHFYFIPAGNLKFHESWKHILSQVQLYKKSNRLGTIWHMH